MLSIHWFHWNFIFIKLFSHIYKPPPLDVFTFILFKSWSHFYFFIQVLHLYCKICWIFSKNLRINFLNCFKNILTIFILAGRSRRASFYLAADYPCCLPCRSPRSLLCCYISTSVSVLPRYTSFNKCYLYCSWQHNVP